MRGTARVVVSSPHSVRRENFGKAGATGARAALDSESVFTGRIVRPAQIHLGVRGRRRGQTARSCRRWRWQRCCIGDVGVRGVAPGIERQDSIPIVRRWRAARIAVGGMFGPTAAISAKLAQPAPVHRSIRKPSSLLELSDQLKLTWVCEVGVAVKPLGTAGAGGGGVVASAMLEYTESPPALNARTRYL